MELMKKVKNYNDFLFDLIIESVKTGTMPFKFSERFEFILTRMDNIIAHKLLEMEDGSTSITLIDITEENDKVSFTNAPKAIEYISSYLNKDKEEVNNKDFLLYYNSFKVKKHLDNGIWKKHRSDIKVGKLVKKIFGDKFDNTEIENFVNLYKYSFGMDSLDELFDIVKREDIVKWYKYDNYAHTYDDTVLHNSCMAKHCDDVINFYAINEKVKMLILYENDNKEKIVGRALVWELDKPKDRILLDRIYTMHDHYINFFKTYAKNNGWLYKNRQSYDENTFVDTKTGEIVELKLEVKDIKLNDVYPYMDTLKYLDQDERILSNDSISDVKLNSTDGDPSDCQWSDLYGRWINMYNLGDNNYVLCEVGMDGVYDDIDKVRKKEDAVYLYYYGSWISKDKYEDNVVQQNIGGSNLLLKEDAIYLKYYGGWTEFGYAQREMNYSKYDNDYYYKNDSIFSKHLNSYISKDESSKVFTDITKSEFDYLPDKSLGELTYTSRGDYIIKK